MTDLPDPPNERHLIDPQRRRAELLATLGTSSGPARRSVLIPVAAGVSAIALVVGVTVAGQLLPREESAAPAAAGSTAESPSDEPENRNEQGEGTDPTAEPTPAVHDMTPEEQSEAMSTCTAGVPEWERFEPDFGLRFEQAPEPTGSDADSYTVTTGYLVARAGEDQLVCTFDTDDRLQGAGTFGNSTSKDIPYLFAPVDGKQNGFGLYTEPVDTVTVQSPAMPEQTAVVRDGYWFVPYVEEQVEIEGELPNDDPEAGRRHSDNELIGVPNGAVFRGYDQDGELVYDSEQDGPTLTCYTDPAGKEVLVHNGIADGDPEPADCRRTLEWQRP